MGEDLGTDTIPDFGIVFAASFRGWLPTVTGRLSFSVFGQTSHPTKANYEHASDGQQRNLVIYQYRDTGDAIVQRPNISSQFLFALVATTIPAGEQEYLLGRAFIIDKINWKKALEKINIFQRCLQAARLEITAGAGQDLASTVDEPQRVLVGSLEQIATFSVHIRICRTGTADIQYIPPTSGSYSQPSIPQEAFERARMLRAICAQIFFFVKDVGHHHQHHEKTTDTITDLHPILDLEVSNLDWRSSTLYNIYRKVIEYKRQPERSTFNDCLGLLAYAEAFRKISAEELKPSFKKKLPIYYSNEVSQSIQATQSKAEREIEEQRYFEDRRTNVFVACFGMIIAYICLMQFADIPHITPNSYLVVTMRILLRYPIVFIPLFFTLVYRNELSKFLPSSLEIKFFRIFAPFHRRWPIVALLLVAALSALMIILLILSLAR